MRIISVLCVFFILFILSCASARQITTSDQRDSGAIAAASPISQSDNKKNAESENTKNKSGVNRFVSLYERLTQEESYEQLFTLFTEYVRIRTEVPPQNEAEKISATHFENEFSKLLSSITVQKHTAPAEIVKNGSFKSAFSVKVLEDDGKTPVSGFPLTVTYPVSSQNGNCRFETQQIKTGENGVASFTPTDTGFTCNTLVTFAPPIETESDSKQLQELAQSLTVEIPCRIYTDLRSQGGAIALVDFNKAGRSNANAETSSLLLTELIRNNGFSRLGNADLNNAVISGDDERVQREARAMFNNSITYLIYGTVKYGEVTQTGTEFSVEIITDMYVRNLKQNELLFHTAISATGTGTRETAAASEAKKQLAQTLAKQLKYGM